MGFLCRSWSRPVLFAHTPLRHSRCLHCRTALLRLSSPSAAGLRHCLKPEIAGSTDAGAHETQNWILMEHVPLRNKELHRQRGCLDHTLCGCEPVVLAGRPRAPRGHGTLHPLRDLILHNTIWFKMTSSPLLYIEVGSPHFLTPLDAQVTWLQSTRHPL